MDCGVVMYKPTVESERTGSKYWRQSTRVTMAKCSDLFPSSFKVAAAFNPAAHIAPYRLVFALLQACTSKAF
jgi:hypothetical protein